VDPVAKLIPAQLDPARLVANREFVPVPIHRGVEGLDQIRRLQLGPGAPARVALRSRYLHPSPPHLSGRLNATAAAETGPHPVLVEVTIGGLDEEEFQKHAGEAKRGCPVSRALGAIDVELEARLA
jgi:hypothetical protein